MSRNGVAFTGVSNWDDCEQKWQSSGQPPVLADRMPSTSTVGPHQARRTSWASAASAGTCSSGSGGEVGEHVQADVPPLVEEDRPGHAQGVVEHRAGP